ncbi:MAG TPA: acyl-CoA desaturase [Streptosporangiaceae bacterium]|nr:acyl-CoA desaturase [Streptosporangiaceae bacterium]
MTSSPETTITPARTELSFRPDLEEGEHAGHKVLIALFVIMPLLALLAAVPFAWGWGLGWHDIVLGLVFFYVSGLGISAGFHRYFTHGSFKATRPLRVALAVAGSLAFEGPVLNWVADHRRHHKYSDREGDPHSPWRYGNDWKALTKGLVFAHIGWIFEGNRTSQPKFCPDLLADPALRRISRWFPAFAAVSLLLPALAGGLWSMSLRGALTALFWAGLVRIALLQHVTWSINSICHTFGQEEFAVRDKARNVSWLAIASFGESWHNLHHADPTCARHGVLKGQIDTSARLIWIFEKLGWAYEVRWPDAQRLTAKRAEGKSRPLGAMARRPASDMPGGVAS